MEKIIHRAASRGHANHGWLDTWHTFSFSDYYDPNRMHFGVLRVLNDDTVKGGKGFGTHPHDNMEIVTIPLSGALEHRDNTGRHGIIRSGDVQIMSAGTGITHSEFNASPADPVQLLQIWVFPKARNITPRYDQRNFPLEERINTWQTVVSPGKDDSALSIHQDAWFSLSRLKAGSKLTWDTRRKDNGIYLFVMEGKITCSGEILERRDGLGLQDLESAAEIQSLEQADILLMDLPMH
ncbi:MAG TPA: pirin family protein [Chitinophagaceae bacterium]|nr:pirin family protein [Chitinophagaceae bacterium]